MELRTFIKHKHVGYKGISLTTNGQDSHDCLWWGNMRKDDSFYDSSLDQSDNDSDCES